ncbi:MAG: MinD/ParA family protein [Myxococcota bacterium]|nr:MinD/ParA family protein [Myxococcota bacterium]
MHTYSITSGKGGVGKTSLVCNMARQFGEIGKKVLLIDADLGLANVDIVMGLSPKANLSDLLSGAADLESLLIPASENVTVLPASSGVQEMSYLTDDQVLKFMEAVNELTQQFDVVLVDTGAGIGRNVLHFNAAAQDVLLIATPEPTSITDAYALVKVLNQEKLIKKFRLIVNRAESKADALKVYRALTNVADRFLDVAIEFLGYVPNDPMVSKAVIGRKLLLDAAPDSDASLGIKRLVESLDNDPPIDTPTGNMQFFWQRLIGPPEV